MRRIVPHRCAYRRSLLTVIASLAITDEGPRRTLLPSADHLEVMP
jgi:hypothetical protein